ncbi:MAG: Phosphoribosyl-AMP cyclohydrolase [Anaerolineae bacterium]|jgi:phosphoribosyl-AMP cyclohydrolase|nr:MAG: Phosphoribosyl-AMP cyclohydrolase [Anaerolineae bacterium]
MEKPVGLEDLNFDSQGLLPVIVQEARTQKVLMLAYMNRQALELTLQSQEMVFWSRSRRQLWRKGETSGNRQRLVELRVDCDADCLLALVEPAGPACHTGNLTCFYRLLERKELK